MSLAQHVTATEGLDREEGEPPRYLHPTDDYDDQASCFTDDDNQSTVSKGLWRPLSYDPFPPAAVSENGDFIPPYAAAPDQESTHNLAAYKVSPVHRLLQVIFACLACVLASGIVFGFASLKPVLIAEGVYSELCPPDWDDGPHRDGSGNPVPCTVQDMRLNLMFIAGSITTNVSSVFAGFVLDRYGRRICWTASSFFTAVGLLLLGYAFRIPEFDGYLAGNVFLGLGGTFLFVSSYQLSNAFPKYASYITSAVTGSFDVSSVIFLLYHRAWEATSGRLDPSSFFFAYLVVPVLVLVAEYALMPPQAYHTTPELETRIEKARDITQDIHSSDDELATGADLRRVRSRRAERRESRLEALERLVGDEEEREERAQKEEDRQASAGVWGVLHGLPAHRQMMTPWFVLILLLTVLQMLRMNYFIATVRSQYRYLLGRGAGGDDGGAASGDEAAEAINNFFDVALPVGGLVATPFIGLVLNNLSVASITGLLTVFVAVIGTLNCLPYMGAAYATVVTFVLFRPFYYSAMSDYATKVFGFATFGTVYGVLICLSGLVNFIQSGLDALTHGPLRGDPTPINAFMAVLGTAIGCGLTLYVKVQTRMYNDEWEDAGYHHYHQAPSIQVATGDEEEGCGGGGGGGGIGGGQGPGAAAAVAPSWNGNGYGSGGHGHGHLPYQQHHHHHASGMMADEGGRTEHSPLLGAQHHYHLSGVPEVGEEEEEGEHGSDDDVDGDLGGGERGNYGTVIRRPRGGGRRSGS